MAGPKARELNGQPVGWTGHVRKRYAIVPIAGDTATTNDDASLFDPPLRVVRCTTSGNLVFTLDGDDEAVGGNQITFAMTAGQELSMYAVRKIFNASTGAYLGFR